VHNVVSYDLYVGIHVVLCFISLPVMFVLFIYVSVCDVLDREDTDMSALVSSLVQLILDDYCRTVDGFQDLIDREWIALGHPWVTRYSASSAEKVTLEQMLCQCTYGIVLVTCTV